MSVDRAPRRSGLDPAVAEVRRAVRTALAGLDAGTRAAPPVVACSGGADSLALLTAAVAVRGAAQPPVHAAIVDHGL
ncbi:MAG: tRNA lysidine(34) synthetase TilS, partial [Pseudonocardia sp.]